MNPELKRLEEYYVHLLQKAIPSLPQGRPERSESPDFILSTEEGQVGIEVTRLFKGPNTQGHLLQVQESERTLLVKRAMTLYQAKGHPPVEVHVLFAGHTEFNKRNRDRIASSISTLVEKHIPLDRSWVEVKNKFEDSNGFPGEVDSISIARFGHKKNYWSVPESGWVQEEFSAELQALIKRKDEALRGFQSKCSIQWLLIGLDGVSGSTAFEPSRATLDHVYSTEFDRLFVVERVTGKAFELNRRGAV